MRVSLAIAALLASFALADRAAATPGTSALPARASDTAHEQPVRRDPGRSERWFCTPTGCSGAPTSSSWSAALGFAAAALAAAGISRRRSPTTA
jgi:MYXO-CTERM domain-containing protein